MRELTLVGAPPARHGDLKVAATRHWQRALRVFGMFVPRSHGGF